MIPALIRNLRKTVAGLPMGKRIVDAVNDTITSKPRRILFGPGKGMVFDADRGGFAGQILGSTDWQEQRALGELLKPGQVFYDIGANIGYYAIIAGRALGPSGHVYAFEPIPESIEMMVRNIRLNRLENVSIVTKAVSDQVGAIRFAVDSHSSQQFKITKQESASQGIEVTVTTIDAWLPSEKGLRPPDVVMIDVEGHEMAVLHGMLGVIKEFKPQLLVEVHDTGPEVFAYFESTLKPLGYSFSRVDGKPVSDIGGRFHALVANSERRKA